MAHSIIDTFSQHLHLSQTVYNLFSFIFQGHLYFLCSWVSTVCALPESPRIGAFKILAKKRGSSEFSHKKGGVGEIAGVVLKKGRGFIYFHTKQPFPVLSLSGCSVCVCVCFVYLHHFYQYYLCFIRRTYFYCIQSADIWLLQMSNFWKEKTLW